MESKTKSESYYDALLEDPRSALHILNEILENEEKMKQKKGIEENESKKYF